jgi:hypothetical protein
VSDQTPPAGWYPQDGQERWWNGSSWSDSYRPVSVPAPAPPPAPAPAAPSSYGAPVPYGAPQVPAYQQPYTPPRESHLVRNLLLVFGLLAVLLVGGCTALVVVVGNRVDDVLNDDTPGGPNNPLTVTEGEPFEVAGFEYAAGWAIEADEFGDADVSGLSVTNDRGESDWAYVTLKLLQGNVVTATVDCTSPGSRIEDGTTVTLDCTSGDTLPTDYDRVTIQDAF